MDKWKFLLLHLDDFFHRFVNGKMLDPFSLGHVQTSKVLSIMSSKTAPFYVKLVRRVRNHLLFFSSSLLHTPISTIESNIFLTSCFHSLLFLSLFNNDMNMCVSHMIHINISKYMNSVPV